MLVPRFLTLSSRWGESAGSTSVSLQLLANGGDTEGLFRGAIMQSGSPASVLGMADERTAQAVYDSFTTSVGCANATDTLECIRQVSVDLIILAMDTSISISSYQVCRLILLRSLEG